MKNIQFCSDSSQAQPDLLQEALILNKQVFVPNGGNGMRCLLSAGDMIGTGSHLSAPIEVGRIVLFRAEHHFFGGRIKTFHDTFNVDGNNAVDSIFNNGFIACMAFDKVVFTLSDLLAHASESLDQFSYFIMRTILHRGIILAVGDIAGKGCKLP